MPPASVDYLLNLFQRGQQEPAHRPFLWVGAGLSIPAGYPSLGQLAARLRRASLEPLAAGLTPFQTVDAFVQANGRGLLSQELVEIFAAKPPLPYHQDLLRLPWKGAITTNYDELLEDACKGLEQPYLKITREDNLDIVPAADRLLLYKVHGDLADFRRIVLTGASYDQFYQNYPLLNAELAGLLRKHSLVFFGCSLTDPRLLDWLRGLSAADRAQLMPSCAVLTKADWEAIDPAARTLLEEGHIRPVWVADHDHLPDFIRDLLRPLGLAPAAAPSFHFSITSAADDPTQWSVQTSAAAARTVEAPWKGDFAFVDALERFLDQATQPQEDEPARAALHTHAIHLGEALAKVLWDEADRQALRDASGQDGEPPLVMLESPDDVVLSLPWELLRLDGAFALESGRIDLVRTTPAHSQRPVTLDPPDRYLKLVVNVSAPHSDHAGLDYEAESYRLVRALHEHSEVVFTELGTVDDLVQTVRRHEPLGIHFSGHGEPGGLAFEDDEGDADPVPIDQLLDQLQEAQRLPRFFYLASCHGNTPSKPRAGSGGSTLTAAQVHRAGVVQVIGYYGPIVDALSTQAEVAIYQSLAEGAATRRGVRRARRALSQRPVEVGPGQHRAEVLRAAAQAFPFAWAQLVLYHRGPDRPLSKPLPTGYIEHREAQLQRTFTGPQERRVLMTGFVGRRPELHRLRRAWRQGQRLFVLWGLGGIGKSTLAFETLPLLAQDRPVLTLWGRDLARADDPAYALGERLSEFGLEHVGAGWTDVIQAVDVQAGEDAVQRFEFFLQVLVEQMKPLVLHLDNLESFLQGPDTEDEDVLGTWIDPQVRQIWQVLEARCGDELAVVASCRYRNPDLDEHLFRVPPLRPDALFRLMGWFEGLRPLAHSNRAQLVRRLSGHPRALEFLDDLLRARLRAWREKYGPWQPAHSDEEIAREWSTLIAPALPRAEDELRADLLFDQLWQQVLDAPARRMVYRMTLLRTPWDWDLMMQLGEPAEDLSATEATARRVRTTSLLEEVELTQGGKRFQVHPLTSRLVEGHLEADEAEGLQQATYARVGTYLEELAKSPSDLQVHLDAGHYLFLCGDFDRAYDLLGNASQWLESRGRVRDGLAILQPFEAEGAIERLAAERRGWLWGTLGTAHYRLSQIDRAIGYHQQALVIQREIGDRGGEGSALGNLGLAYAALGQVDQAIAHYQQALVISREIGDRGGEGSALGNLGVAYRRLGQVDQAIDHHQQALVIHREIGDRRGEGNSLAGLGLAYSRLGQVDQAIDHHQQALVIHREIGDREGEGSDLGNLGLAYARLGQVDQAIAHYQQALVIQREIGDRRGEGSDLGNLGLAYADLGQVDQAIDYHQQALVISREIGDRRGEGSDLGNLGLAYAALGQVDQAIDHYQQALVISREIGDRLGEGSDLGNLGNAYADLGQVDQAIAHYQQALVISREIGDRLGEGNRLGNLGSAYARSGQTEKARQHLQQALTIARQIQDPRIEEFVQRALQGLDEGEAGS